MVDQADPVVGWCRGSISVSRIVASDVTPALAWAITSSRLIVGTGTPVQTFDPWDSEHLERQDILGMGHLPCPPTTLNSADVFGVNRETMVTDIHIKVGRKLHRNTNNLFLWVVGNTTDDQFGFNLTMRTLMKF